MQNAHNKEVSDSKTVATKDCNDDNSRNIVLMKNVISAEQWWATN